MIRQIYPARQPAVPEARRSLRARSRGALLLPRLLRETSCAAKASGTRDNYSLYPIAGGEPRPVPGLAEADVVAHWSTDGRSVLAYRRAEIPCRLERVDIATGQRSLFKELAPADRAGLLSMRGVFVTDDLRSYRYTTYNQVSSLFVSEGSK